MWVGLGWVQKFWVGLGVEKVTHDQLCLLGLLSTLQQSAVTKNREVTHMRSLASIGRRSRVHVLRRPSSTRDNNNNNIYSSMCRIEKYKNTYSKEAQ